MRDAAPADEPDPGLGGEEERALEVSLLPFITLLGAATLIILGVATFQDPASRNVKNASLYLAAAGAFVGMGGALVIAAVGLLRRAAWGWWIAVGVDLAFVALVVVLNLTRPPPDLTWLLAPAFAGVIFVWLYAVRREFGVSFGVRGSSPLP